MDRRIDADAEEVLRRILAAGPRDVQDIFFSAKVSGVTKAAIRRAARNLKVVRRHEIWLNSWTWELPEDT